MESAVGDKQYVNVNGDARWKSICFELGQTPDVVHQFCESGPLSMFIKHMEGFPPGRY